jgi:hypothetical protein
LAFNGRHDRRVGRPLAAAVQQEGGKVSTRHASSTC